MKRKILLVITTIILLNSCLIGFSLEIIPFVVEQLSKTFTTEKLIIEQITIGIFFIGFLIGIFISSFITEKFGRKKALILLVGAILISLIISNISKSLWIFFFLRFVIWIIIGTISIIIPLLIVEISSEKIRGRIILLNQVIMFLSIYTSVCFDLSIQIADNYITFPLTWIEFFSVFVLLILILRIPESPLWLCINKQVQDAKEILHQIGIENPNLKIKSILEYIQFNENSRDAKFFNKTNYVSIKITSLMIVFYQLSGICIIIYYTPLIFKITGIQDNSGLILYSSINITHLLFTVVSMILIDTIGRRILLMIGSCGMVFFLAMLSRSFLLNNFTDFAGLGIIIYIMGFIAFFSFSLGSVAWVIISEIFPLKLRAKGQAFGSLLFWSLFLISYVLIRGILIYPSIKTGGLLFALFGVFMITHFIFVLKKLPDTERKSLETIQLNFKKTKTI